MKTFTRSLNTLLLLGFLFVTLQGNAQTGCTIAVTNCPPSVGAACANAFQNNVFGSFVTWTPPVFTLTCTSGGGGGDAFQMSFDLPESQNNCWEYNRVQRVGTGGGRLRLWQSTGTGNPYFTTPQFFLPATPTSGSMQITNGSGNPLVCNISMISPTNVITAGPSINISGAGTYSFSLTPPSAGVYKLRYTFTGSGNNSDYVELLNINASLFGTACTGDINFATVVNFGPGSFFPIGTTTITYTSSCNSCSPPLTASCSFDVIVNGVSATAVKTDADCGLVNGTIKITATSSNTSPALQYNINNAGWVSFTSPVTIPGLAQATYSIDVRDYFANMSGYCSITSPLSVTVGQNIDVTKPVINCPAPVDIEGCSTSAITVSNTGLIFSTTQQSITQQQFTNAGGTATDACGVTTWKYQDVQSGSCPIKVTRTFTVGDASGNTASCSQIINVKDITPPVISTLPGPTTINCPAVPVFAVPTATDNCGGAVTLTHYEEEIVPICAGTFAVTRVFVATDACGNTATASQTINVQDVDKPTASNPADITLTGCNGTFPAPDITVVTDEADNCSTPVVAFVSDGAPSITGCTETVIRTYSVTDDCGNSINVTQNLKRTVDTQKPVLTVPIAGLALGCNPASLPTVNSVVAASSAIDNCGTPIITAVAGTVTGTCSKSQTFTVTATDGCNNTDVKTVTYTWTEDLVKPVIATTAVSGDKGCNPTIVAPVFTLTEACSPGSIVVVDGGVQGAGCAKSQTWTANFTDACGNVADTKSITYTWTEDLVKPVIATTAVSGDKGCNPTIVAPVFTLTEACSPGSIVVVDGGIQGAGCAKSQTWTANFTDACGNIADTKTITYTWTEDLVKPVIATTEVSGDKGCNPTIVAPVFTLTEACSPGSIVVVDGGVQGEGCAKSQTWTANFTDACGNIADTKTITYTWTVDLVKPVIATTAVSGDKGCNPTIVAPVFTLTEACSPGSIVVVDGGVQGTGCAKSQTWTANFTDACGNVADTKTITYTWTEDLVKPVIATTAVSSDKGCNPNIVAPVFTLTEACSPGSIVVVDGGVQGTGCAKSQTWTANFTDACGNVADTKTITYTWTEDLVKPVIATTAVSGDKGCNPTIVAPVFTLTEACSSGSIVVVDGGVQGEGCAKSQTWTANFTDACGNIADEKSVTYTWIQDTQKPAASNPAPVTVEGCSSQFPAPDIAVVTDEADNCSTPVVAFVGEGAPAAEGCTETIIRTYSVTDACGNSINVFQSLTRTYDITAPQISELPGTSTIDCPQAPEFTQAIAIDACDAKPVLKFSDTRSEGNCAGTYSVTRTWTATDACGNSSSASQTINVQDVTPPHFSPLAETTIVECSSTPAFTQASVNDDCDPKPVIEFSDLKTEGECGGSYTLTRTWTATDACGNSSTASQTIIAVDKTAPVISCIPNVTVNNDRGRCNAYVEIPVPGVVEGCSQFTLLNSFNQTGNASGVYSVGTTSVTWTATDECGNSSSCLMTVTVVDNELPSIACPNNVKVCLGEEVKPGTPETSDNCGVLSVVNNAPASFPAGNTTVIWTVTDIHNNVNTCAQTVTVVAPPAVEIGPGLLSCEGQPVLINSVTVSNYSSFVWVHDGEGILQNANTLNPTYVPAAGETGTVNFALTVYGESPCGMATDVTNLIIIPLPTVNAGSDKSICENQTIILTGATAANAKSTAWTTSGTGTFASATSLSTEYIPSAADIASGSVTLTITAFGLAPCRNANDNLVLSFVKAAKANAGTDALTCNVTPVKLDAATATNYSTLKWTTSGSGTFDNSAILNPVYTPSAGDVTAGKVTLTLKAEGNGPCGAVSDEIMITITPLATASAGADMESCDRSPLQLAAAATNYSAVAWTSSGTGSFSDAAILNAVYTPSQVDLDNGSVEFTLKAIGKQPCGDASDKLTITLRKSPLADAGPDMVTCKTAPVQLAGAASNYTSVKWTATGTGSFDDAARLNAVYTPGVQDEAAGSVELTLTVNGNQPCGGAGDKMLISFGKVPTVTAGADAAQCTPAPFTLADATASDYATLEWSHNGAGTLSDIHALHPVYTPAANEYGVIVFKLTAKGAAACDDLQASAEVKLTIHQPIVIDAGSEQLITEGTSAILAGTVTGGTGQFTYSWAPAAMVNYAALLSTSTKAVDTETEFTLTATDAGSGCKASDAVLVKVKEKVYDPPQAIDDNANTNFDTPVVVNVTANDIDPRGLGLNVSIQTAPLHGTASVNADGTITYTPNSTHLGYDTLFYTICDKATTPRCASAKVVIITQGVRPYNQIVVYNLVTPNGDNKNDRWTIRYIEEFPDNSAVIFNRWGDKMNEYKGYNNTTVSWDATDRNGKRVPDGTYYYVLKIAGDEPRTGWILVTGNTYSD